MFPETQSAYHPRAQRSAFCRRGVHQQRRWFTRYEVALTFAFAVVEESIEHAIEERFGLRERDSGIEDCALEVEVWRAESQVNTALFLARILKPHHQPDYLFCSQAMCLAKFGRRRIVIDRYEQLLASRVAVYLVEQLLSRFPRPFRIR